MYDPIEYFDEMNILQSDKERRIKKSKQFLERIAWFFVRQLLDLVAGIFLFDKSRQDYIEELMDIYIAMMPSNQYDTAVREKAYRFANYIQDATERAVANAKGNESYQMSRLVGGKMKEEDIPSSVKRMFSDARAMEIALNETNWIYNYLNHLELAKSQNTHTWASMKDERVRIDHWQADGQTVPINEPFVVGGYRMMFPLDDSLGAPVEQIINCRCVEL